MANSDVWPKVVLSGRIGRSVECLRAGEDCGDDGLTTDPKLANSGVWPKVVLSTALTDAILHVSRLAQCAGPSHLM